MAFIMRDEKDLLDYRQTSNISAVGSERSVSTMTTPSIGAISLDAGLLANATAQATIAARSIMVSGGTEGTALKTAKAAAQSVLLTHHEKLIGSGPKGFVTRRKIKKQADIIASMAIVSAFNSIHNNQWGNNLVESKSYLVTCDSPSAVSTTFDTPRRDPEAHLKTASASTRNSQKSQQLLPTTKEESINQEDRSDFNVVSQETSPEDFVRPVAIRVETRQRPSSPLKSLASKAILKQGMKFPAAFKKRQGNVKHNVSAAESEEARLSEAPKANQEDDNAKKEVYDQQFVSEKDDDDEEVEVGADNTQGNKLSIVSSVSTTFERARELGSGNSEQFMESSVDPYIFRFTDIFHCFGSSSTGKQPDSAANRDLAIEQQQKQLAQLALVESQSGSENQQSVVSYDVVEIPTSSAEESEESSYYASGDAKHRIEKSNNATDEILKRNKDTYSSSRKERNSGRRRDNQFLSEYSSSSSGDEEQYSVADSRNEVESHESYESSGSSDSEESRRHKRKGFKFGWKGRR
jgi:hypothetical protein